MAFQVLCVDDDPHVLTVLRWVLEAKGYSVTAAESGTAALAHLAEPFDAAVLDYDLPDINGALLAERLNRLLKNSVPVFDFG
jgi:CheY-like chemotaxis protein